MTHAAWQILYRGPLASCNYACDYCPFAKTRDSRAALAADAAQLERFIAWVEAQAPRPIGVLFTPWGEALIRRPYQRALVRLSHMAHVTRAVIQTNLSAPLAWLDACDLSRVALWVTYHPTQLGLDQFVRKCAKLDARGARYSVGVVGLRESFDDIEALRQALSPEVYLWVNAYKREPEYYSEQDVQRLETIDPLFRYNTRYHVSQGAACAAGHTSFTVDGAGDARRCHFLKAKIGNIYEPGFEARLEPRPCDGSHCGCHIGYVHKTSLGLYDVYGEGVLERIPREAVWRSREARARALGAAQAQLGPHPARVERPVGW